MKRKTKKSEKQIIKEVEKKTEDVFDFDDSKNYLTEMEFLKWRICALEIKNAELELKEKGREVMDFQEQLRQLQFKIQTMTTSDGPDTVQGKRRVIEEKRAAHLGLVKEIEQRVGYSLSECAVDDLSLEIIRLQN